MRKLGHMMKDAVAREEILRAARAQTVLKDWSSIVGSNLASRSQPERYERGTVWIAVESSTWAQELRMGKETILARLRDRSGEATLFVDLRFGVRPVQKELEVEVSEPDDDTHKSSLRGLSIREIAEQRLKNWRQEES